MTDNERHAAVLDGLLDLQRHILVAASQVNIPRDLHWEQARQREIDALDAAVTALRTIENNDAALALYAWVGEDEHGSGEIGIKQGLVPAGFIPLVSMQAHKLMREELLEPMQDIVDQYRKPRRLVKFVEVETLAQQVPKP